MLDADALCRFLGLPMTAGFGARGGCSCWKSVAGSCTVVSVCVLWCVVWCVLRDMMCGVCGIVYDMWSMLRGLCGVVCCLP